MGDLTVNKLLAAWSKWIFIACLFLLSACGGGSGGGTSYSVTPTSMTFSAAATNGVTPSPKNITITVNAGTVYLAAVYNGNAINTATLNFTGPTTAEVSVYPEAPGTLGTGTHTGTVAVYGCSDVNCNSQISGSPVNVNVTYTVNGLNASRTNINLASAVSSTSPTVQSTISSTFGTAAWTSNITYSGATQGWLTMNVNSGVSLPATIDFSASGVAAEGTYIANVRIDSGANSITLPVTYVVSNTINPFPGSLNFTVNDNPLPSQTRQIITGAQAGIAWTASSDVAWLDLSPTSGGGSDVIIASLNQTQLDGLFNGVYNGIVTLTPSAGLVESIPVTLTVNRSQVSYVAPYTGTSNKAANVIIRGENFNQATIQNVKFGTVAATSFSVINSTQINAAHPALTAGTYSVNVETASGNTKTAASLVILDAPAYNATNITYPNATAKTPLEIIYDAERQALLVAVAYPSPGASGDVLRYTYTSGAWSATPASVFITNLRNLGLSTNGKKIITVSNYAITQHDPITLNAGTSTSAPFGSFYYLKNIASMNNGNSYITTGLNGSGYTTAYLYSLDSPALTPNSTYYFGTPGVSADGSHISIVQGSLSPAPSVYKFDSSDDTLTTAGISLNQNYLIAPELDRDATRVLLNGYRVYNANYQQLGSLPTIGFGSHTAVVLSPDGARAYTYTSGTNLLRTYDLNSTPVAGLFPEVGTGTVLTGDPGNSPKITISPDGGTLFIAGADRIVVVPAP